MKRKLPLILFALLACALLFALPLSPEAHADIDSGIYDGVPWVITDEGELIIGDGTDIAFASDVSRYYSSYGWYGSASAVKTVRFIGTVRGNGSMGYMFYQYYNNLTSADLRNFYGATYGSAYQPSLTAMFFGCDKLTSVQVGPYTGTYVEDFSSMFQGCTALTSLNLSNLNTSSAEYMGYMFQGCVNLTNLNISGFNTANVTDFSGTFQGCTNLSTLTFSSFATNSAANCFDMFNGCSSLSRLDLSTLNLTTATNTVLGMTSLQEITLATYTELNDIGFYSIPHFWGVSDENYNTARTGSATGSAFPNGTGAARTFKRVIEINYDNNGGAPPDDVEVVVLSSAGAFQMHVPLGVSPPTEKEFKCWKDPNGDYKYAGDTVNLLSYGTDTVVFEAQWRIAVTWAWPSSSQAIATTVSSSYSRTDNSPVFLSDNSTCTTNGESTYRATVTFEAGVLGPDAETYTNTHAFFTAAHHTLVHHGAVAPKCTVNGNIEYWNCTRGCGQYFTDGGAVNAIAPAAVVIPATGHSWAAPTYTWAANNRSVTARHVCTKDASHVETETRAATAAVTRQPTCTEMGRTTYTAAFSNASFLTQYRTLENIPALGHAWAAPTYTWSEDNRTVDAQRICTRDNSHREDETAASTLQTLAPTCTTAGIYRYTAVFTNPAFPEQEKLVTGDPALGHDLLHCEAVPATCTETGAIEYWKCLNCGDFFADAEATEEIPDHNSVITPALGHVYLEEWDADASGHWHNCKRCSARTLVYSHVPDHIPTVEAPARCIECGYVISPALVVQSHAYFGMTGDLGIGTVTYTKTKILDDDWVVELPERVPKDEGYYFEGWLSSSDICTHIPGTQLPFTYTERKSVIVRGLWTEVIGEGHHDLGADTRYRFDEGSYTISGDSTVYLGEQPFYPASDGSLDVTKAG